MDIKSLIMGISFALMWSSAFTSARVAVAYASPLLLLSLRFLLSGILAIFIARMIGESSRLTRQQWIAVVIFGLFQNGVYLGVNFVAMQWIEASLAAIIASLLPLLVAFASWVFLRQRLSPVAIAGLFAGLVGVWIIMSARLGGGADPYGVALCFTGVIALTLATLMVRGAISGGNVVTTVGYAMLVGSTVLFLTSVLTEDWFVIWTWQLGLAFAYTMLVAGLLATLVWFYLVRRIGATRAAAFHFLNPFLGVAIAALIVGEDLGLRDVVGVIIISLGILAVQLENIGRRRADPTFTNQ